MFSKKKDLDNYVQDIFRKCRSEKERNAKCMTIARQYANFQDWATCRRYIGAYIQDHPNSAPALRLQGDCEEKLGNNERALNSYRSSLAYDDSQKDMVFKVCELLYSVEVDADSYQYWADRAEALDSCHPAVFKLKEHILTSVSSKTKGSDVPQELEALIMAEQKSRPTDPSPNIRLLKLLLEKSQFSKAYALATQIESGSPFRNDISWYQTIIQTLEASQKQIQLDWQFHSFKLLALERLTFLYFQEMMGTNLLLNKSSSKKGSLNTIVETVFKLDQALFAAQKISQPNSPSRRTHAGNLLKHVSAQLAYYLVCIFLEKAKKDSSLWKNCTKMCGPLLLLACQTLPPEEDSAWLKDLPETLASSTKLWIRDGSLRRSQTGHVLLGLNNKRKFMDLVSPLLVTKWQDKLFEIFFAEHSKDIKTSYLATSMDSNNLLRSLPTPNDLWPCDEISQIHFSNHLPLMIWYGLRFKALGHPWAPLNEANDDPNLIPLDFLPKRPLCSVFSSLKKYNKDLPGMSQPSLESMSQMDIDAFIFATVACAAGIVEENQRRWSEDRPEVLPVALTDSLCTTAQNSWWSNVCKILNPLTRNHSVTTETRKLVKSGLESIRSVDSQSGHQDVRLLCALARYFTALATKAYEADEDDELAVVLFLRASHYWSCAKPALENIKSGRAVRQSHHDGLFNLSGKELDQTSAKSLLYEACFFDGMQLVRSNRHEEAIEAFGDLSSPYASMEQALLYKKMGETEASDMAMKEIFFKRSRDNFYVTLDRLKGPKVDQRHPLNGSLRSHIEEIEEQINQLFPDAHIRSQMHAEDILSDVSDEEDYAVNTRTPGRLGKSSTPLTSSRTRPVTLPNGTPINGNQRYSSQYRSPALTTPRPREEARPSPERLEAQMRQLSIQRESDLQAMARIVEATRSNDSGLKGDIMNVKETVRDMNRDQQTSQREIVEINREIQDMNRRFKDLHGDVQKILKLLKTTHLTGMSSGITETRNIPDEELYMYGEEEMENEYGAEISQLQQQHLQKQQQPTAAGAAILAGNIPGMYNPSAFPFRAPPPNFFPLAGAVDTAALMYQNLAYLAPGALPFSEGQRLPEFQVAPPQLMPGCIPVPRPTIASASVSAATVAAAAVAAAGFNRMPPVQVPVITEVTPQLPPAQPDIQLADAQNMNNSMWAASPHAFQISMPAEAHVPTASPLDKEPPLPVVLPQTILQNVPSPAYSSVTPESQKKTPRTSRVSVGSGEDGEVPEHDAMSDFKPIIPLPDEIVPTTGEEGEVVLFENRAKLFRFVEGEWKERGVGALKVLESATTKKARIIMRREQVLKVCCNHQVPADIALTHISGNDKTWSWAAHDFADESVKIEKFGVRFKTVEEANAFKDVIDRVKNTMPKTPTPKPGILATPKTPMTPATSTALPVTPKTTNFFTPPPAAPAGTVSFGGFTFTSAPTLVKKPDEDKNDAPKKKEDTPVKASPFSSFTFGSVFGKSTTQTSTATTTTAPATTAAPSLGTTSVFQNAPVSQFSFASIAQNNAPAAASSPFSTPTSFKAFEGSGSMVFGGSTPLKSTATPADSTSAEGGDDAADEFVPTADFKPVVPLPELIEIKTGEEGEEVLYEHRAKLLQFVQESKEWKERGIGKMKMTWSPESCKVRLVMRREQVLKVCCNHFLSKDLKLVAISSSDRSWTWIAQDYSDGEYELKTFAIKFKNPEDAQEFHEKWLELQNEMVDGNKLLRNGHKPSAPKRAPEGSQKSLSEMFKPATGNWECKCCYVSNKGGVTTCVACCTPKEGAKEVAKPAAPALTADKDLMTQFKKPAGNWECKECYVSNKGGTDKCVACESARPGSGSPDKPAAATKSIAPGLTFDFKTSGTSKFSFGNVAAPAAAPISAAAPTSTFTFGGAPVAPTSTSSSFAFGTTPGFSFGGTPSKTAPTTTSTPSFSFSLPTPSAAMTSATITSPSKEEESDDEVENDEGEHIHFTPVIPLPDKVEVVTGEEDEEVLYSHRAKLYRWATGEWKERGLGDLKILRHKQKGTIRLLMRREQVLKICLNHLLSADINFTPKGDAGRSFQWFAADFSEGEVIQEQFAILFKTEDIAKDFMSEIDSAKALLAQPNQSIVVQANSPAQISTGDYSNISSALDMSTESNSTFQTPSKSFSFAQDSDPSAVVTPQSTFASSFAFGSAVKDSSKKITFGDTSLADDDLKILEVIVPEVSDEDKEKARALCLPDNFFAYKQRPACKGCRGCEADSDETEADKKTNKEKSPAVKSAPVFGSTTFGTLSFGSAAKAPEPANLNGNNTTTANSNIFLPSKENFSFASLAQDNATAGFDNLAASKSGFLWAGAGTPVFGGGAKPSPIFGSNAKPSPVFGSGQKPVALFSSPASAGTPKSGKEESEDEGEVETHDPHFDPIIALPDIVTVKTGEEDEEKIFCQRAKLYRYDADTKEWKERGVGEMKILYHQATGRYRLLLRREQVHKVVLNQLLNKDLEIKPMKTSNNAVCWGAINHDESGEAHTEELAVRFKNEDLLTDFKAKLAEALARLATQPPTPVQSPSAPSPPPSTKGPKSPPVAQTDEYDEAEEEGEEEEDDEDEEDYETYDEDYEETDVMEERGTVFSRKDGDPAGPWLGLGVGNVKILYNADRGNYNVVVELDLDVSHGGETVRIAVDPVNFAESKKTQDKEVCFSGMNEAQGSKRVEYYKVLFQTPDHADEFQAYFMEGLAMVEQNQNEHDTEQ